MRKSKESGNARCRDLAPYCIDGTVIRIKRYRKLFRSFRHPYVGGKVCVVQYYSNRHCGNTTCLLNGISSSFSASSEAVQGVAQMVVHAIAALEHTNKVAFVARRGSESFIVSGTPAGRYFPPISRSSARFIDKSRDVFGLLCRYVAR